ncbi:hypothetical protein [Fischerella thermalis]|uniref:hypothetical protein n=1 Tax=Fischerella thermalis TaxID=372787 RepID=UPI0015E0CD31|nr:hypothetical protein [Fischerella thermalis]
MLTGEVRGMGASITTPSVSTTKYYFFYQPFGVLHLMGICDRFLLYGGLVVKSHTF